LQVDKSPPLDVFDLEHMTADPMVMPISEKGSWHLQDSMFPIYMLIQNFEIHILMSPKSCNFLFGT
jgi:hypothetical protein